jgi:hypothetical protein
MHVDHAGGSLRQRRGRPGPSRHSAGFARIRLLTSAAVAAVALLGCGKPAPLNSVVPTKARAHATKVDRAQRAPQHHEASIHFMTFALNALLVPLLDDDWPPRWADPSLSFDCAESGVEIDGAPLDIGAPVPAGSFTVRWHMERCMPFENNMALTGDVELRVEPVGAGYRVVVQPARLVVRSAGGHDVLTQAFTARISLGR